MILCSCLIVSDCNTSLYYVICIGVTVDCSSRECGGLCAGAAEGGETVFAHSLSFTSSCLGRHNIKEDSAVVGEHLLVVRT